MVVSQTRQETDVREVEANGKSKYHLLRLTIKTLLRYYGKSKSGNIRLRGLQLFA
jgi:hypothetical protein